MGGRIRGLHHHEAHRVQLEVYLLQEQKRRSQEKHKRNEGKGRQEQILLSRAPETALGYRDFAVRQNEEEAENIQQRAQRHEVQEVQVLS